MYGVLIVDDEPLVRKRLRTLLDWEEEGFVLLGEASDGEEALSAAGRLCPDIVLTDIRMPVVDGLKLTRELNHLFPGIKIVIVSGYSDFEYAKEAMKYGIKDYLLKPLAKEDLTSVLNKIKDEIERDLNINQKISEGENALKEKLAFDILYRRNNVSGITSLGYSLGYDIKNSDIGMILFEIEDFEDLLVKDTEEELQLKRTEIRNMIEETVGCRYRYILVEERADLFLLLYMLHKGKEDTVSGLAQRIHERIVSHTSQTVTVVSSRIARDIHQAGEYFKEARAALDQKFLFGRNIVIDMEKQAKAEAANCWEVILDWESDALFKAVEEGDESRIHIEIEKLFCMMKQKNPGHEMCNAIIYECIAGVVRLIRKIEGDITQIIGKDFNINSRLNEAHSMNELERWFQGFCLKAGSYIRQLHAKRAKKVSEEVVGYIRQHYAENITLKSIAKRIYMNPVYLGQLFKNDMGISFNDYLAEVRINMAGELLKNTPMKIYEVSEKVGYKEPSNFYKAFKKLKGVSPAEYKLVHSCHH